MTFQDTPSEALAAYFGSFPGSTSVRKRVFKDGRDAAATGDNDEDEDKAPSGGGDGWRFSGSVFVTFEDVDSARAVVEGGSIDYQGDRLR